MKKILSILALVIVFASGSVFAHGSHGKISGQDAKSIAYKSVKQMTFKDLGFEPGKLNESWKKITDADISVVEVGTGYFVVSAKNTSEEATIYFKIATNGQVLAASETNIFSEE